MCDHRNFAAQVEVGVVEGSGQFMASIEIQCDDCGRPFRFLGLPSVLDLEGPAVDLLGTEARLAIEPAE